MRSILKSNYITILSNIYFKNNCDLKTNTVYNNNKNIKYLEISLKTCTFLLRKKIV